jgi:ABC-type Fe3+ transport system permease subunit
MREADVEAVLVANPVNLRYLTGFHSNAYSRPLSLIAPRGGPPALIVPRLEELQARQIGNSIALAAGGSALVLAVGAGVAYVRSRTALPGRERLAAAASYTVRLPSVAFVTGVIWAWIRPPFALYGTLTLIALAQAARVLPVVVRNMEDGLGQLDRALEEAARACGAGRARVFVTVTLPLARVVALAMFSRWRSWRACAT